MSDNNEKLLVEYEVNGVNIKLTPNIVQTYITNGTPVTVAEYKMFSELCKVYKLNPFMKEAYCIKYGNQPAQITVSKDVFLKKANNSPDYDGMESGIVIINKDGKKEFVDGSCYDVTTERIIGAWAKVYRKSRKFPSYVTVAFNECVQRKRDGSVNSMWQSKPAMMVEKVAKSRALKEAFLETAGGAIQYDDEVDNDQQAKQPFVETTAEEHTTANNETLPEPSEVNISDL